MKFNNIDLALMKVYGKEMKNKMPRFENKTEQTDFYDYVEHKFDKCN